MADFATRLGASESGNRYDVANSEGYVGRHQFGDARLEDYRRATGAQFTKEEFRQNPALQDAVFQWHIADIDKQLSPLVGKVVNGQTLDLDALRGMAHLGGIGGARQYVSTQGRYNPADSNGTRLSDYAGKFGGSSASPVAMAQSVPTPAMGGGSVAQANPQGNALDERLYSLNGLNLNIGGAGDANALAVPYVLDAATITGRA